MRHRQCCNTNPQGYNQARVKILLEISIQFLAWASPSQLFAIGRATTVLEEGEENERMNRKWQWRYGIILTVLLKRRRCAFVVFT